MLGLGLGLVGLAAVAWRCAPSPKPTARIESAESATSVHHARETLDSLPEATRTELRPKPVHEQGVAETFTNHLAGFLVDQHSTPLIGHELLIFSASLCPIETGKPDTPLFLELHPRSWAVTRSSFQGSFEAKNLGPPPFVVYCRDTAEGDFTKRLTPAPVQGRGVQVTWLKPRVVVQVFGPSGTPLGKHELRQSRSNLLNMTSSSPAEWPAEWTLGLAPTEREVTTTHDGSTLPGRGGQRGMSVKFPRSIHYADPVYGRLPGRIEEDGRIVFHVDPTQEHNLAYFGGPYAPAWRTIPALGEQTDIYIAIHLLEGAAAGQFSLSISPSDAKRFGALEVLVCDPDGHTLFVIDPLFTDSLESGVPLPPGHYTLHVHRKFGSSHPIDIATRDSLAFYSTSFHVEAGQLTQLHPTLSRPRR